MKTTIRILVVTTFLAVSSLLPTGATADEDERRLGGFAAVVRDG